MLHYRFKANLIPTTPLFVLEMHHAIRAESTSVEDGHGHWEVYDERFGFLAEGGGMASPVGTVPRDGGDLLEYLTQLRRIVETPVIPGTSRIEDSLGKV